MLHGTIWSYNTLNKQYKNRRIIMSIKRKVVSRAGSLAAAVAVALGALVPAIVPMVGAAGQVQTRSIEMSDATPAQAGVTYTVSFTPATAGADSIVIDFCN